MRLNGVWCNNIASDIERYIDIKEAIEMLLSLIDASLKHETQYHLEQDQLYSHKINSIDFIDWLYDYTIPELRDLKRELSIHISRSQNITSVEYSRIKEYVVAGKITNEKHFFVSNNTASPLNAWDKGTYYRMKRYFLVNTPNKNTFSEDLPECFENLFFHPDVAVSLNTLNNEFSSIKDEIVAHLGLLEDYHSSFAEHRKANNSNREVSLRFMEFAKISCSPQSGRDTTKALRKDFLNTKTNEMETILCELHTKFNKWNRDRERQDRIYFHPGKDDIENGKVLIIHIGKHL